MSKFASFQNIFSFPSSLSMLFLVLNLFFPISSIFIHKSYLYYRTSPKPEMNSFPKLTFCANIGLVYGQTSALNLTTFINKITIQTDIQGGAWMGKYQQQIGLKNPVMSISCNKYVVDLDPDESPLLYISIKTTTFLYVYKFNPQLYFSPISLIISPIPMPYPYQFHEQSMALEGNTFAIAYSNKNITVYRIEQPQQDQGKKEGEQRERDWDWKEGETVVSLRVIDAEGKCGNSTVRIIMDHLGRLAIVCQVEIKSEVAIRRSAKFMLYYGQRYDMMVEADQDVDAPIPTSYVWNRLVYQRYWDVGYEQASSQHFEQSNLNSYPPDYPQSIFFLRFQQSYSSSFKYLQFSTSSSPTPLIHSSASPQKQGMQFFCQHKGYAIDITSYCYQGIGTVWTGCYDIRLNQHVLTGTCTQVPSVIPMADDQVVLFVLSNADYNYSQIVYVDAFREAYVVTWIGITFLGLFLGLNFMVCQAMHCDMFQGFQKRLEGQI